MLWLAALRTGEQKYRDSARMWSARLAPRVASKSVFKGFLFWYGAQLGGSLLADSRAAGLCARRHARPGGDVQRSGPP
ncbi:hypothetical protein ACU4HD_44910 (plasmid) [Cupriavidus basilensis]